MLKSNSPLVSVLIPFYNAHEFVLETVESIFRQNYENFEIVIVNDGSRLPSVRDILTNCDSYSITFIDHETNRGLAAARNTAFYASKGELVVPLDADDLIHPNFLKEAVSKLEDLPDISAVYSQVQIFGDVDMVWSPNATLAKLMSGLPIPSTVLFRRNVFEMVGGYNLKIKSSPDVDFWLRVFASGAKILQIDEPLYFYRKYKGSLSDEGKLTEVEAIVAENENLFFENLEEICVVLNNKYQEIDFDLNKLKNGYVQLAEGYFNLRNRYADVVEQLSKRDVSSPPLPPSFVNSDGFESAFDCNSNNEFMMLKIQRMEIQEWIAILGSNERIYFRKKDVYDKIDKDFRRLESEYLSLHKDFEIQIEFLKQMSLRWQLRKLFNFKIFG
ncbi:glycosyltransferase family 2 protein [bacterium]|nr:glycosyltransferase family 2 protein [bacterium]